jgi:hypothetical protein
MKFINLIASIFGVTSLLVVIVPKTTYANTVSPSLIFPASLQADLFPREPDFFKEGREQFEKEIEDFILRRDHSLKDILELNSNVQDIQRDLAPFESKPKF